MVFSRTVSVGLFDNSPLQIFAETLELLEGFLSTLENFLLQKQLHNISTDFLGATGNAGFSVSFQSIPGTE